MLAIVCFFAGCIAAMFTRSKLYAIVLPSLITPVVMTIRVVVSSPPAIGEAVVFTSPFIVAAFLMGLMYGGLGALVTWRLRGRPSAPGVHAPSKALLRHLARPISVSRYCDKYHVTQAEVEAAIGAAKIKGYSERGITFVDDEPPPPPSSTQQA